MMKTATVKYQLREHLNTYFQENNVQVALVLLADDEEVGRELIPISAVLKFRWDIICRALETIESRCGDTLVKKKFKFRLERP